MGKIRKVTDKITNAVGGRDLANYVGAKLAKGSARKGAKQFIDDSVSGKKALTSAAKVGASLTVAGAIRKAVAKKVAKDSFKIAGQKKPVRIEKPKGKVINKGNKWSDWGWN